LDSESWALLEQFAQDPQRESAYPSDRYARRLVVAVQEGCAPGDAAGLLRACLMSRSSAVGTPTKLPCGRGWLPDRHILETHGVLVDESGETVNVSAGLWEPAWLDGSPESRVHRQRPSPVGELRVPSDPEAHRIGGFEVYLSQGQATAVRCVANQPPGSTVVVNLPTGSGKSLAFEIAFSLAARESRASILVVPTIALALDQESRLNSLPGITARAYHSGLTAEVRSAIRRDFRHGSVHVVITSPESLLTALVASALGLAERGHLAWVAVDEAHMIATWGADFRPEFQLLGGFIRQLRNAAPSESTRVSTLLLSATITNATRRSLTRLFGAFVEVAAVSIRPEPEYWVHPCASPEEKFERVIEAVRFLPRPCVVYTSTRDDAKQLFENIRDHCEVERIRLVRGGDLGGSSKSDQVLQDWAAGRVDIIVGTSAFGLGIDNRDVRTVIHACIPENADRFYQEVGRAGRDGRNSISMLVPGDYPHEWRIAEALSEDRLIGDDLGWRRWDSMRLQREVPNQNRPHEWTLNLNAVRVGLTGPNDKNRLWNLRTLVLMQSAGMLRLGIHVASDSTEGPEIKTRRIRVEVEADLTDQDQWTGRVRKARKELQKDSAAGLQAMRSIVSVSEAFNHIFATAYEPPAGSVRFSPGWDPVTRREETTSDSQTTPCGSVITGHRSDLRAPDGHDRVFHFANTIEDRIEDLLIELASRGVVDFEIPSHLNTKRLQRELSTRVRFPIIRDVSSSPCRTSAESLKHGLALPGVSVIDSDTAPGVADLMVRRRLKYLQQQIVLLPEALRAPDTPHLSLATVLNSPSTAALWLQSSP
jgi:ATP-dependent DNA helicase RecQ